MTADSSQPDDQSLIARIDNGDQAAFAVLYERYKNWVLNLAFRFTGNHDDALDVLQETFSYFVRKFPGFELTAQMTTFLYPAVKNYSITARKKRQRATGGSDSLESIPGQTEQAEDSHGNFQDVLGTMSDAHREILLMRFVDGLTQPEISQALDLPLGTVKSRLHHAVQAVKNSPAAKQLLEGERQG